MAFRRQGTDRIEDLLAIRIGRNRGDPTKGAVRLKQVDDAPVGELGDRQLGCRGDRVIELEGLVEPDRRVGDQAGELARPTTVLDVHRRTDKPEEMAVRVDVRRADVQDPVEAPVVAPKPVLHLERPALLEGRGQGRGAAFAVGRMHR